jgi:hypothetical protein
VLSIVHCPLSIVIGHSVDCSPCPLHPIYGHLRSMIHPLTTDHLDLTASVSLEIEAQLKENVDYFYQLRSPSLKKLYSQFVLKQQTLSSLFEINIAISIFTIPFIIFLAFNIVYCNTAYEYLNWFSAVLLIPILNGLIWRVYFKYKSLIVETKGNLSEKSILSIQQFQKWTFFFFHFLTTYRLVSKVVAGSCKHPLRVTENWNCNQYGSIHAIPAEVTMMAFFEPVFYMIAVRGANLEFAMFLWIISVVSTLFCMVYSGSSTSTIFVSYCIIGSLILLTEIKKFNYFMFFSQLKLNDIMIENERIVSESKATEMKHIIGNVAHDLKTVGCNAILI